MLWDTLQSHILFGMGSAHCLLIGRGGVCNACHLYSLSEPGAQQRKEYPRNSHVISRLRHTRVLSASVDAHAARDVSHRHLIALSV